MRPGLAVPIRAVRLVPIANEVLGRHREGQMWGFTTTNERLNPVYGC